MKIFEVVRRFPHECIGGTEHRCKDVGRGLSLEGHVCFMLVRTQKGYPVPELVTLDQVGA
jgi:hypothetical protein